MTELSRKKNKGVGVHPIMQKTLDETQGDLLFMTNHKQSPRLVDLNIYATGVTAQEIEQDKQRWKRKGIVPFAGRPQLITELAPHFRRLYGTSPASSVRALSEPHIWTPLFCKHFLFDCSGQGTQLLPYIRPVVEVLLPLALMDFRVFPSLSS